MAPNKKDDDAKKDSAWAQYNTLLVRYPLAVNATQSAVLGVAGSAVGQVLDGASASSLDWAPILNMGVVSAVMTPLFLWWYGVCSKLPGGAVGQTVIDQVFFGPLCNTGFFALTWLLQGVPPADLPAKILAVVPGVTLKGASFWGPQRFITIALLPTHLHSVFGSVCGFVWNIVLSFMIKEA